MNLVPSAEPSRRSTEPAEPPAMGVMGGRESLSTHMLMPPGLVVVLRVVLSEQILAVVVAVGRADDRVDMIARGLVVVERDAALVIELDQDDRAVDAVVVDAVLRHAADPREAGLVQVPRDLFAAHSSVAGTDATEVRVEQPSQQALLAGRQ